jgi:Glyoxalase-like domain
MRVSTAGARSPSGLLRWRIAVRDDGAVLCGGAMPTLIEWGERHPAASMPVSGVVLRSLVLRGVPSTAAAALGLTQITFDDRPGAALEARLATPRGLVTLLSRTSQ